MPHAEPQQRQRSNASSDHMTNGEKPTSLFVNVGEPLTYDLNLNI